MKLSWNDVSPYFEEAMVLSDEQDMYWYQCVWQLLDESNMTSYYSLAEKQVLYSRIYATVKIYREFCNIAFGESPEFCLYFDGLTDDEEKQAVYNQLIEDDNAMQTIFDVLKTKMGINTTFCSLWITWRPQDLGLDDLQEIEIGSYEDYTNALSGDLSSILNFDLNADKLASFEWLSDYMTEGRLLQSPNSYEYEHPLLSDYIELFLKNSQIAGIEKDKRVLFYRGQSDKTYSLVPSVFRKGLLNKEHILIQDLLLKSPENFSGIDDAFERLIKMQHYNLPTRLLDVTMNPLVALFFACNENMDKDGEVIVFYDYMEHPSTVNAKSLVSLAEYSGSSERQMLGFLTDKGLTNLELGGLTKLTHIPIEAPESNERIKRQHGAFIIFGIHGEKDGNLYQKTNFDLRTLLVKDFGDGIPRSIIIPKETKIPLIRELDAIGINHAFLFPELEHQALYIRTKHEEV
jgi:hypothetical protein